LAVSLFPLELPPSTTIWKWFEKINKVIAREEVKEDEPKILPGSSF